MSTVIIAAAGTGSRMKAGMNKQFIPLLGRPMLAYTLEVFQSNDYIESIILVAGKDELLYCKEHIIDSYGITKADKLVEGGSTRQESVYNGLAEVSSKCDIVLVHDGARPIVKQELIRKCIDGAKLYGAVSAGVHIKETVKIVDGDNYVEYTPERENVWVTQTPQAFRRELLKKAHDNAVKQGVTGTDDAYLVELLGHKVKMIEGYYENIKVTTPEDLITAETILKTMDFSNHRYC